MHVGNALEMAANLLLLLVDEVARNGAFRKILRPEVFPDAPLHFPYFCPPEESPNPISCRVINYFGGNRVAPASWRQSWGRLACGVSSEDELLLHVDTGLPEKLGNRVGLQP
jgi:hypothetical protein